MCENYSLRVSVIRPVTLPLREEICCQKQLFSTERPVQVLEQQKGQRQGPRWRQLQQQRRLSLPAPVLSLSPEPWHLAGPEISVGSL